MMKTKLVYVLTCNPQDYYIEQAHIAIWSARYYNPDTHIVLITDDMTNELLTGTRGELLNYVSDKIVVPFDESKDMRYRSRWLKTSVRNLIKGDYLFIDTDTIVTRNLSNIEQIDAEIAMVRDENMDVEQHSVSASRFMISNCSGIGVDILKEKYYFNSGVMYVKETVLTHSLYELWHAYWMEGYENGISVDQAAFAKANITMHRPVKVLDNRWNVIVGTHIEEIYSASILHFAHTLHSVFYLYSDKVLSFIRDNGMNDCIKYYILHPTHTFLPPDNHVYNYKCKDFLHFYKQLKKALKDYARYIDETFEDFQLKLSGEKKILWLMRHHIYSAASALIVLEKMYRVKISTKYVQYTNFFARK